MNKLPAELIYELFDKGDFKQLKALCFTNKKNKEICDNYMIHKLKKKYYSELQIYKTLMRIIIKIRWYDGTVRDKTEIVYEDDDFIKIIKNYCNKYLNYNFNRSFDSFKLSDRQQEFGYNLFKSTGEIIFKYGGFTEPLESINWTPLTIRILVADVDYYENLIKKLMKNKALLDLFDFRTNGKFDNHNQIVYNNWRNSNIEPENQVYKIENNNRIVI